MREVILSRRNIEDLGSGAPRHNCKMRMGNIIGSSNFRGAARLRRSRKIGARMVVDTAYHTAGATAVSRSHPFERWFRDMHAITQQIQARDTHHEHVGR